MRTAKTANIDAHAMATLRYIRASMDAAARVAIPGSAGVAVGAIGCAAALISLVPQLQAHWLSIWLTAAPFAAICGGVLLSRPASLASFVASGTPGRKLALGLLPGLFAGAMMTLALCSAQLTGMLPGTWLLLYGCALISASVSTLPLVAWMGSCFAGLGIVAFLAPATLQLVLLGLGFGGLHIVFGILIGRGSNGCES